MSISSKYVNKSDINKTLDQLSVTIFIYVINKFNEHTK